MAGGKLEAGAMGDREVTIFDLHLGMGLAAQLPHRFDHLGHAAAINRVVGAKTAPIGVERKLADTRDQVAVGDELAALPLFAKAEIFELNQYRDGKVFRRIKILCVTKRLSR